MQTQALPPVTQRVLAEIEAVEDAFNNPIKPGADRDQVMWDAGGRHALMLLRQKLEALGK